MWLQVGTVLDQKFKVKPRTQQLCKYSSHVYKLQRQNHSSDSKSTSKFTIYYSTYEGLSLKHIIFC